MLEFIANLIKEGYVEGYDPRWSIEIENDTEENRGIISDLIVKGFTSGCDPTWSIEIREENRLEQLLEKEFITVQEMTEIEEHELVDSTVDCGLSGRYPEYKVTFVKYFIDAESESEELNETCVYWK